MQYIMKCSFLSGLLLFLLFSGPAMAWRGTVEDVLAGDILTVKEEGSSRGTLLRLYGVDAPEMAEPGLEGQPFGLEAFELARQLLPKGQRVVIHDMRQDTMGRDKGGIVTLPGGVTLQEELLKAGLAWVTSLHCGNCRDWKSVQQAAREAKRGLWRDESPEPPWEWRLKHRQ